MHDPHRHRLTRLLAASSAFMIGAAAVIWLAWRLYLLPAYIAWRDASPQQRNLLSASSMLLLALVLIVLLLLLLAAFGVRRFFFRSPLSGRSKTDYVDAWEESGRRMRQPQDEET